MIYKKIQNNTQERSNILHKYIVANNIFSEDEISKITNYCNGLDVVQARVSGGEGEVNKKVRESKISYINPSDQSNWIFQKLNELIENINDRFYNFDLNGYNYLQYSVYDGKDVGKYDFHMDSFLDLESQNNDEQRKLSAVMMLSDPTTDFVGGEFQMNFSNEENPENIILQKGSIVFFPSFFIHRVNKVTKGSRKTLVLWITGPKFR